MKSIDECTSEKYPIGTIIAGKIIEIQPFGYIIEFHDNEFIEINGHLRKPYGLVHGGQYEYKYHFQIGDDITGVVIAHGSMVYLGDVKKV